ARRLAANRWPLRRRRILRCLSRAARSAAALGGCPGGHNRHCAGLQGRSADPLAADFAKLIELFDAHGVSFVSVTQSFNTSSSMGRLTLNVLLSFAQFEREVIGERVRDKIAASKRKGIWVGGPVPLGYAAVDKKISRAQA